MNEILEQLYIVFEIFQIGVLFYLAHIGELNDLIVVDFHPEFLNSFIEHVVVLV